jgi:hypothetical protein
MAVSAREERKRKREVSVTTNEYLVSSFHFICTILKSAEKQASFPTTLFGKHHIAAIPLGRVWVRLVSIKT